MSLSTRSTPIRFIARNRIKAQEPDQIMMTITPNRFQPNPRNDSKPPSHRIPESLLKMGADKTPQIPPPRWTVQKRKKEKAITKLFIINISFTDSAWWDFRFAVHLSKGKVARGFPEAIFKIIRICSMTLFQVLRVDFLTLVFPSLVFLGPMCAHHDRIWM